MVAENELSLEVLVVLTTRLGTPIVPFKRFLMMLMSPFASALAKEHGMFTGFRHHHVVPDASEASDSPTEQLLRDQRIQLTAGDYFVHGSVSA